MPVTSVGQIIEVTFRGSCDGQTILNIVHGKIATTTGGDLFTYLGALIEAILDAAGPADKLLACVASDYKLVEVVAQAILPVRYRAQYEILDPLKPGTQAGTTLPSSVSACVTKQADGTGPHSHGQIRYSGIPFAGVSLGSLTPEYMTDLRTNTSWLKNILTTGGVSLEWVILNKGEPAASQVITEVEPMGTSRVVHRRVVGRGI